MISNERMKEVESMVDRWGCCDDVGVGDVLDMIEELRERRSASTDPDRWPLERYVSALDDSVKLQSHYARQLNQLDGGRRITFDSGDEWIERLEYLRLSRLEGGPIDDRAV